MYFVTLLVFNSLLVSAFLLVSRGLRSRQFNMGLTSQLHHTLKIMTWELVPECVVGISEHGTVRRIKLVRAKPSAPKKESEDK